MKDLRTLLEASLLDIDTNLNITDEEAVITAITQFINDNYRTKEFTISKKSNKDSKYEVSSYNIKVKNKNITSLTNDLFIWSIVKSDFDCSGCDYLKSLKGAPKEVGDDFNCNDCYSLTTLEGAPGKVEGSFYCNSCNSLLSLEGAPKEVGKSFYCDHCKSLQSLEGAPKEVGWNFYCYECNSLQSLEGAPKEVGRDFFCNDCKNLTSLEGAPKEVKRNFDCSNCKVKFEESDVRAVSNVKGEIIV